LKKKKEKKRKRKRKRKKEKREKNCYRPSSFLLPPSPPLAIRPSSIQQRKKERKRGRDLLLLLDIYYFELMNE
tara:strand:+ start:261 stop:479 length:219 start_codon:yes stop_codon:yes gene_type:complete